MGTSHFASSHQGWNNRDIRTVFSILLHHWAALLREVDGIIASKAGLMSGMS